MPRNLDIKNKREELGISAKDFADALGWGIRGDRLFREYERQSDDSQIPDDAYNQIMQFAAKRPFAEQRKNPAFSFIDLFAGIGGIRIPFQELGGNCVFSSEWNEFAQKTYKINYGETPAGDITKIGTSDIPDFDILLAGFPCQPFSQAGLHKGFADTRGTLFFEIERIIKEKKQAGHAPHAFLLENVKQLKGHDHGRTFKVIMDHLKALNYYVTSQVLRASDYGVPQHRERIYIVGFDKDYFDIPEDYEFRYPEPTHEPTSVGSILDKDVDQRYIVNDKMWEGHKQRKERNKAAGKGFGYSLFNPDSPYTNTISARYYKDGSEALIDRGDGLNPRRLTPRECSRLQGFPEDFIIPVSDTQAYKQFGNSVCVPVIRAIAKRILEEMGKLSHE